MSKRKSSVGSDGKFDASGKRVRSNRGQNGRADQMLKLGEALTAKPRKKAADPKFTDEPVNPMAPGYNVNKSCSRQKSVKSQHVPTGYDAVNYSTRKSDDTLTDKMIQGEKVDSTVSRSGLEPPAPVKKPAAPKGRFGLQPAGTGTASASRSSQSVLSVPRGSLSPFLPSAIQSHSQVPSHPPTTTNSRSQEVPVHPSSVAQSYSRNFLQENPGTSDHDPDVHLSLTRLSSHDPDLQHEDEVEVQFSQLQTKELIDRQDSDNEGSREDGFESDPDAMNSTVSGNDGGVVDAVVNDDDGDGATADVDFERETVPLNELYDSGNEDPPSSQAGSQAARVVRVDGHTRPRDVLKSHQIKNGRPRVPDNDYLLDLNKANPLRQAKSGGQQPSQVDDEDVDVPKKSKGPKYSKTPKENIEISPTTLAFYPPHWKSLLRYAKSELRLHCATGYLFTSLEVLLEGTAREILSQSLTKWKDDDRALEEGIYRVHKLDMHRLIVDEAANFRSVLKKMAIAATNKYYDLYPRSDSIDNHAAYIKHAKRAAAALLKESDFLRDGVDDMGKPRNFAHPAIRECSLQVYYRSSKSPLGVKKLFERGIPLNAVVAITTAIIHVLKSIRNHGHTKNVPAINADNCSSDYRSIQKAILSVDKDPHHGPRLRKMLKEWGTEGSFASGAEIPDGMDSDDAITLKL